MTWVLAPPFISLYTKLKENYRQAGVPAPVFEPQAEAAHVTWTWLAA